MALGVLTAAPAQAEIYINDAHSGMFPGATALIVKARLFGAITPASPKALERTLQRVQALSPATRTVIILDIDSTGGDVPAALAIGRLLRTHQGLAHVEKGGSCSGACVLVLAGGASRSIEGKVLLTKPRAPDTQVAPYLTEMGVKPELYDDMLSAAADKPRELGPLEMMRYGLRAARTNAPEKQ